jgi:hypothetical protein
VHETDIVTSGVAFEEQDNCAAESMDTGDGMTTDAGLVRVKSHSGTESNHRTSPVNETLPADTASNRNAYRPVVPEDGISQCWLGGIGIPAAKVAGRTGDSPNGVGPDARTMAPPEMPLAVTLIVRPSAAFPPSLVTLTYTVTGIPTDTLSLSTQIEHEGGFEDPETFEGRETLIFGHALVSSAVTGDPLGVMYPPTYGCFSTPKLKHPKFMKPGLLHEALKYHSTSASESGGMMISFSVGHGYGRVSHVPQGLGALGGPAMYAAPDRYAPDGNVPISPLSTTVPSEHLVPVEPSQNLVTVTVLDGSLLSSFMLSVTTDQSSSHEFTGAAVKDVIVRSPGGSTWVTTGPPLHDPGA